MRHGQGISYERNGACSFEDNWQGPGGLLSSIDCGASAAAERNRMGNELRGQLGRGDGRRRKRAIGKAYQLVRQRSTGRAGTKNPHRMGRFKERISGVFYKALTAPMNNFLGTVPNVRSKISR